MCFFVQYCFWCWMTMTSFHWFKPQEIYRPLTFPSIWSGLWCHTVAGLLISTTTLEFCWCSRLSYCLLLLYFIVYDSGVISQFFDGIFLKGGHVIIVKIVGPKTDRLWSVCKEMHDPFAKRGVRFQCTQFVCKFSLITWTIIYK